MATSDTDQASLLKEVLEAVKTLQLNQAQISASVDAISGRVNVLAGLKEVQDIAAISSSASTAPVTKPEPASRDSEDSHSEDVVPPSPSLPATQFGSPGSTSQLSHARKPSVTSRIILT